MSLVRAVADTVRSNGRERFLSRVQDQLMSHGSDVSDDAVLSAIANARMAFDLGHDYDD